MLACATPAMRVTLTLSGFGVVDHVEKKTHEKPKEGRQRNPRQLIQWAGIMRHCFGKIQLHGKEQQPSHDAADEEYTKSGERFVFGNGCSKPHCQTPIRAKQEDPNGYRCKHQQGCYLIRCELLVAALDMKSSIRTGDGERRRDDLKPVCNSTPEFTCHKKAKQRLAH